MDNAFLKRLRGSGDLDAIDESRLRAACHQTRSYAMGCDMICEGEKPGPVFVILSGWAARYKVLPNGERQIIAFLMPGDFCDMHVAMLNEMDHSICTLTPVVAATIQRAEMEALVISTPRLTRAFWATQLIEAAILRATIVSIGRRDSLQRVAHSLSELCLRMRNVGIATGGHYTIPFSQIVLADAVGLTPVHLNRIVRKLKAIGAIDVVRGSIVIDNLPAIARIAGFDDNYLHRTLRSI